MDATQTPFGALLRRYRVGAGLTQEDLARRSAMSARGISDLERGVRRVPRRDTIARLALALGLSEDERLALEGTVRRARGA
jgi:transcriptional regulator with XRE-family HTH domain